jgi:dolichyl-phosphate-mannose--protein O-mannosyl transferase
LVIKLKPRHKEVIITWLLAVCFATDDLLVTLNYYILLLSFIVIPAVWTSPE